MLSKVLIANRGEIAVRVIRTCRELGITTVAVYSELDRDALHVRLADEAYALGGQTAAESYLNTDAILNAIRKSGADAVHPGYGFFSENTDFARAITSEGVVFIGPPPEAIEIMGDKISSRIAAQKAGVAGVPGTTEVITSPDDVVTFGNAHGWPVAIKAAYGGGGRGMRVVESADKAAAALESAQREAEKAFGRSESYLERYLTWPRHIEMQVFADRHGNAVHLFERDCSLQRRHQKVIEEVTAPGMPKSMREQMGAAAVRAAKAVGYVGAGTVEFIADSSVGLKPDCFWFMEMNTRLQVEHPVTEMITGIDLVEWQLRVAAGESLPKSQKEIRADGHAIEARLYAEDPRKGFLPSTGRLEHLKLPAEGDGVRVDTGVRPGDCVSVYYDPMIAKVIAHDQTREAAAAKLAHALCETQIAGVRTNTSFLIHALRHPEFLAGEIDTGFIDRNLDALLPHPPDPSVYARAAERVIAARTKTARTDDPWDAQDGFRLVGEAREKLDFTSEAGAGSVLVVHHRGGGMTMTVNGTTAIASAHSDAVILADGEIAVMDQGETISLRLRDPFEHADAAARATDRVAAPMPGKIIRVAAESGATVKRGQPLVILEAMKMEHTLTAPADAKIESVDVSVGDQVREGTVLLRFATPSQQQASS
jgi:3-methylcrotonyl-CoA carboxylase alpha subunit